jgi:hypothetical protein
MRALLIVLAIVFGLMAIGLAISLTRPSCVASRLAVLDRAAAGQEADVADARCPMGGTFTIEGTAYRCSTHGVLTPDELNSPVIK